MNFAIFSVFVTLIVTEIMGSVLLLTAYEKYKGSVLSYIIPIWEVTGTFGAFWVVSADLAYPPLLIPVAVIFSFPIMLFLILFVGRNATISFAEFIIKKGWLDDRKLYKGYAIASLLMGIVIMVVIVALIGGNGVNIANATFSAYSWVRPDGLLFIAGAVLLIAGLAPVFYNDPSMKKTSIILVFLGILMDTISFEMFKNWHLTYLFIIPDFLAILLPILYFFPSTARIVSKKVVFIALTSSATFLLNFMAYPTILGGEIAVNTVTNSGPVAAAFFPITVGGGIPVGILLFLYAFAAYRKGSGMPQSLPTVKGEEIEQR